MKIDLEKEEQASFLRGSLIEFCRFFYEYLTGREFLISQPTSRESHHITICKVLTQVFNLEILREVINVHPGSHKSTILSMFVAWAWAHYPDCNFLYISHSQDLSVEHTAFIKSIVSSPMYQYLFDVGISKESRAKESFKTTAGGAIKAFGSAGPITGMNAGLPNQDRFSGAVLIDDSHKPDEAASDTIRKGVIENYGNTIRMRPRGMNVPIIYIGQRVHEDDLANFFISGKDVREWHSTVIPKMDIAGNVISPELMNKEEFLNYIKKAPYVAASQFQQDPLPAGGALFKPEDFVLLDKEPNILATFITCDTAETEKSWNDASVFSFWGVYNIEQFGRETDILALHWLDCKELRVEPKDLEPEFLDFYRNCCLYPVLPNFAAIEKKSTGVTLVSVLKDIRGLKIREIERTRQSGSKADRFIGIQQYVGAKRISLPAKGRHVTGCLEHMQKITANNAHAFDDMADTVVDACHIAFVEKSLYAMAKPDQAHKRILSGLTQTLNNHIQAGVARNAKIS